MSFTKEIFSPYAKSPEVVRRELTSYKLSSGVPSTITGGIFSLIMRER